MPRLSGRQVERLSAALRDAFSRAELARLLYVVLGKRLDDITLAGDFETQAFETICAADRQDWILALLSAACDARPANSALHELAAEVKLTAVPPGLERIIRDAAPLLDFPAWWARFGELQGQVCRIEIPAGSAAGTGFLVGPDLVLTSYHVVDALAEGHTDPSRAVLRFDYKRAGDGTEVNPGTTVKLADDWLVAARPWSPLDGRAADGHLLPEPDELDFALLRVAGAPGSRPVGSAEKLPEAPRRGWIRSTQVGSDGLDANRLLFILQHPVGAPLQLAFGSSDGLNANKTRLRYRISTEHGSSGSPCLNERLELVALHQAGDDPGSPARYNTAVPVSAIRDSLADHPVAAELFAEY